MVVVYGMILEGFTLIVLNQKQLIFLFVNRGFLCSSIGLALVHSCIPAASFNGIRMRGIRSLSDKTCQSLVKSQAESMYITRPVIFRVTARGSICNR